MFRRVGFGLLAAAAGALVLAAPAAAQTVPTGAKGATNAIADTATFVDVFGVPVPAVDLFRPLDVIAQAVAAAPCTGSSTGSGCLGGMSFLNIKPGS